MKTLKPLIASIGLTTALVAPALAQKATPEQMGQYAGNTEYGTMHLKCGLGSFKTKPKEPTGKAEGRFDISFTGTVLLNELEGSVTPSEGLTLEFDDMNRKVYHGTGRLVVEGKWRGLQWFGSDMTAVWFGNGLINVIGEFDKNLQTGEYWYSDPEAKGVWPTTMMTYLLPEQRFGRQEGVVPTRRGEGGN